MENIKIRMATIDDLSALENVGDRLFDNQIQTESAVEFLNDLRHHLVLALNSENVVGMASGFDHLHPDKNPALFIDEVGVLDEFQGRGIGCAMVRYLCDYGKKLGCEVAWVLTENTNSAARKTYLKAGGKEDEASFVLIEFED